jgi:uncharacterized damage-inducible protein DinB
MVKVNTMSTAINLIERLHQHRAWVNDNLLTACATLKEEQLRQSFPIGQGSIWKSLLHLYAAEYVWLEALLGNDDPVVQGDLPGRIPGNQMGEGGISSFAELKSKWNELQQRWDKYLIDFTEDSLNDAVYKISTSSGAGQRFATKRSDILLHVCTHAQYTTAQVLNMLRQIGVKKMPETMLISLARHEAK